MHRLVVSLLGVSFLVGLSVAQDKWVWNGKTAKAVRTESGRVRYGLYEPDEELRPQPRPPPPDLPPLVRPHQEYPRPHQEYPRPQQEYPRPLPPQEYPRPPHRQEYPRPPPPSGPEYTRPPPPPPPRPQEKPDQDPTRFDKCKCVHSFNCKSPGLLFGSCDAGKKYCCEKTIRGGGRDFVPDDQDPEVLAGPGGPVDHLKKPVDIGVDRPPRPGKYGLRPDGSLGAAPSHRPYVSGPRY